MIHQVFEKHLFVHNCIAIIYTVHFAKQYKLLSFDHKTRNLNIILSKHHITGGYRAPPGFWQLIYYKDLVDLYYNNQKFISL